MTTSTGTQTLSEFLLARIAEDEAAARAAAGSPVALENPGAHWVAGETNNDGVRRADGIPVCGHSWPHEMDHIARWDPARVLAECEAKRRIVRWVQTWPWRSEPPSSVDGLLPMLALPYADHPDYRSEWKP